LARQRSKKKTLRGPLIFAAVVGLVGLGFAGAGHFSGLFGFVQTFQSLHFPDDRVATGPHAAEGHLHGGGGTAAPGARSDRGHGNGTTDDRIAWPYLGAVLFDGWVLFAVTACYIFIQRVIGVLGQARRAPS
jgi:hypothetical protein